MTVARLVLDRPERANALDADAVESLHAGLDRAEADGALVVVVEARGRTFCGGLDLGRLDDETDATLLHRLVRVQLLLERLRDTPAVTVARVTGAAVGAGADLALATDVRLALPRASLRFPGSGFGAVLGTGRLAALTTPSFATEAALSARRIDASEAAELDLLRVTSSETALDAAVARTVEAARVVPTGTVARLRRAAWPAASDDPLGHLVRSLAATPGLRDRIRHYREQGAVA